MMLSPRAAALLFMLTAAWSGLAPLVAGTGAALQHDAPVFPGWPAHIEGRPLAELPLSTREAAFAKDFPGRIGRFSDGGREIIIRYVASPTRKLHPAADCFRGIGYRIEPMRPRMGEDGVASGCLRATRGAETLVVCEAIRDQQGRAWSDVSAWYWDTLVRGARGPWWSFVMAERL